MVTRSPWSNYSDEFGRTIDTKTLGEEVATPQTWGTRRVVGEAVASGLSPLELAAILQAATNGSTRAYLTLAEEMEERYLHYASQVQTRKLAIGGVSLSVEHDDQVPSKIVDAVNELVEPSAFDDMVASLTDGIAKSYSVSEMMWDYDRSRRILRPERYVWRDPRFFQFDEATQTELRLADMADVRDGLRLSAAKFIIHQPRSKMGLPIRRGLARPAAWAFMIQQFTLADWASFAEIYGVPLRVGKFGPNSSETDRRLLLQAVRDIANDAAGIIPAGMEVEFHKVEGSHGAAVFGGLIDYVDKQVSKLVLGQTMTSDNGSSQAQANVHNDVRLDILRADCKQLATTINRDLIVPFVIMNFGEQDAYPRVELPVPDPEDIAALTQALERLVPLGLRVSARQVREKVGLAEPEDDEELLSPPAAPPAPTSTQQPTPSPSTPATSPALLQASASLPDDAIDLAIAAALEDDGWRALVEPMVDGLQAKLESAATPGEARRALAEHFRGMDVDELAELLARSVFAARLAGATDQPLADF